MLPARPQVPIYPFRGFGICNWMCGQKADAVSAAMARIVELWVFLGFGFQSRTVERLNQRDILPLYALSF